MDEKHTQIIQEKSFRAMVKKPEVISAIAAALPDRNLLPERIAQLALTAYTKAPQLWQCEPMSIIKSVLESAQLGLELDSVLGHAYIVPYKKMAAFQIGYRGYINLAMRSEKITAIGAEIVYSLDSFALDYAQRSITHKPGYDEEGERGVPIGVYAWCRYNNGFVDFEYLTKKDVERLRSCSASWRQQKESSIWEKWWEAMWRKSAIRSLCKRLPLQTAHQRAVLKDEAVDTETLPERELSIGADVIPELPPAEDETLLREAEELMDATKMTQAQKQAMFGEYSGRLGELLAHLKAEAAKKNGTDGENSEPVFQKILRLAKEMRWTKARIAEVAARYKQNPNDKGEHPDYASMLIQVEANYADWKESQHQPA